MKLAPSLNKLLPGLVAVLVLALISYLLREIIPLSVVLIGLILGIIVGNSFKLGASFSKGISWSGSKLLEAAIIFMAFNINYRDFINLGWETIAIVVLMIAFVLITTYWLSKWFKCPGSTGWLVGFGTAICGSSAIAALAPQVSNNKDDVGISLAVVNALGLIGMVVLPFAAEQFFNPEELGILIGTSLHAMGNVAGAGFTLGDEIGEIAVTVKLGRIALLTPAVLIFGLFLPKHGDKTGGKKFALPYYLILFILISILVSLVDIPKNYIALAKQISSFLLTSAMVAIGLKMSIAKLYSAGKKGFLFGLVIFVLQLGFITVLLKFV